MNDIEFAILKKARLEAEKEIISENMMGLDFLRMICEVKPVIRIAYRSEDFGTSEMEFKKGEW
jgi:hypothetical protein